MFNENTRMSLKLNIFNQADILLNRKVDKFEDPIDDQYK